MFIAHNYEAIPSSLPPPLGLTIGNFDGCHLGHQFLIRHLRDCISAKGSLAVFTFSNHPSHVLHPLSPSLLLTPYEQKIRLLEDLGVDLLILQRFDSAFSQTPFDVFLQRLHYRYPFQHLLLGEGEAFGKNKEGNEQKIKSLSGSYHFTAEYVKKRELEGTISSCRIRSLLSQGNISQVSALLGRPYSLYFTNYAIDSQTEELFVSTLNLATPPDGYYPGKCKMKDITINCPIYVKQNEGKICIRIPPSQVPIQGPIELIF